MCSFLMDYVGKGCTQRNADKISSLELDGATLCHKGAAAFDLVLNFIRASMSFIDISSSAGKGSAAKPHVRGFVRSRAILYLQSRQCCLE